MKFLPSLIVLGLSTQALASSYIDYVTKDGHGLTVYKVIDYINTTTSDFNARIQSYEGGDLRNILDGGNKVTRIMKIGAMMVKQKTTEPLTDAQFPSFLLHMGKEGGFEDTLKKAMDTLIVKKSLILASGKGSKLGLVLYSQQMASIVLSAEIIGKIPAEKVQDFRSHWHEKVIQIIGRAVDTFDTSIHPAPVPSMSSITLDARGAVVTNNSPAGPAFTSAASAN
ncbi:hypothetical protein TMatcc_006726 [Talaromyces marneffei ATCC 18224]|uniref:Mp1p-like protein 13 n=2 Tax=Talaromyces marneffei TaxID=37727 RepID=B6Q992_TALMQ|nr:uncharacterized protein EYB26_008669 [Talaromyces marneffei]EEA19291.1 hypothetical protein PMAA_000910 [Talaromyces marneffei ATCC 18224]ABL85025.1 Mp1p-like protein 11 [Talaromyces marneffei]EEA25064.1 hypothetical protein PMAA_061950 [Talaromyces marneffei ATCC 18224]KAE8547612.1 hypothetical protein EYB25_009405 [Talaromyces marneffei]QGA20959.1 hypothetical protein EYB26_008669 [Talaromyces marneffei]